MLGAQDLLAGRGLYCATPALTLDFGFSDLIQRTAQFRGLLRLTRVCGETILTRIITGSHSVASYNTQGGMENLFESGSRRDEKLWKIVEKSVFSIMTAFVLIVLYVI
jgi:hypothetical protein